MPRAVHGARDARTWCRAQVFVERKTHKESWTGEESLKERGRSTAGALTAFLCGDERTSVATGEESERRGLVGEVVREARERGQRPILR